MTEPEPFFQGKHAASYDKGRSKMAPIRDALHFLMQMLLGELPDNAHVLCVGVGTGAELVPLAQAFPMWRFTAVEPAAGMLDVCRQRAEDSGIASRCTFHEGYLDSLPGSTAFDAATSILVSHFLTEPEKRRAYFESIAGRLVAGGLLVNADLASDMSSAAFESLFEVWLRMLKHSEMPDEEVEKIRSSFGTSVAVVPPDDVESLLASSGFGAPVRFFQTLLIHGWYSRRAA